MANIDIGGRLHSTATGNVVAGANEIFDDDEQKKQSQINAELIQGQEDLRDELDEKQGIITAVVTPTITEDGGDPAVESSFENSELALAFKNLKGDKGEKGDKGDKGDTGEAAVAGAGDLVLTSALGNSQVKAMSQDGITKVVMNNFVSEWKQKTRDQDTQTLYPQNGSFVSGSNNNHIYSVAVNEGDIVKVSVANSNYSSATGNISFTSVLPAVGGTYETLFTPTPVDASTYETIIIAPGNGYVNAYIYSGSSMSCKFFVPVSIAEKIALDNAEILAQMDELESSVDEAISGMNGLLEVILADLTPPAPTNSTASGATDRIGFDSSNAEQYKKWLYASSSSWGYQVDISKFAGKKIRLMAPSGGKSLYAFLTSPWTISQRRTSAPFIDVQLCEDDPTLHFVDAGVTDTADIPATATYLWVLWKPTPGNGYAKPSKVEVIGSIADRIDDMNTEVLTYHVNEESGSDDNTGLTETSALKTVSKALSLSGSDVSLSLHGKFYTPLTISGKNAVRIQGNGAYIFGGVLIDSAEPASGYDGVYVASGVTLPAYESTYGMWLWQIGEADTRTAITLAERHPAQLTYDNRLRATKIVVAASLEEVSGNSDPSYYYDATGHNLYFKSPSAPSASKPILIRSAEEDYAINIQCRELLMTRTISIGGTVMLDAVKSELIECNSMYGCHGFRNNSQYGQAVYMRCEACGCFAASGNGDGFGGGTSRSTLIDCWAHDCFDDGYSEHNGSRSTIIGGLFEYCGKGGIVPSGSYTSIIGATCRHCGGKPGMSNSSTAGILYTLGTGKFVIGDLKDCVCYDNVNNYLVLSSSGSITLTNCHSSDATEVGYKKGDGAYMIMRGCRHNGTGTARSPQSSSAVIIDNGTLVS